MEDGRTKNLLILNCEKDFVTKAKFFDILTDFYSFTNREVKID